MSLLKLSDLGEIQYRVCTPASGPLSQSRWTYYQFTNGTIARAITLKSGHEGPPSTLSVSSVFPDAMAWAKCLHEVKPQFHNSPAANELYTTLANAAFHDIKGSRDLTIICCQGMIRDLEEWIKQLKFEEAA